MCAFHTFNCPLSLTVFNTSLIRVSRWRSTLRLEAKVRYAAIRMHSLSRTPVLLVSFSTDLDRTSYWEDMGDIARHTCMGAGKLS